LPVGRSWGQAGRLLPVGANWSSTCVDVFRGLGLVGVLAGGRDTGCDSGARRTAPKVPEGCGSGACKWPGSRACGSAGRLTSRDRRAICRDETESNAKQRGSALIHRSTQEKTGEVVLCVDVLKGTSRKVAPAPAKLFRNSLARKRSGVRISSAPRVMKCKVSNKLLLKRC